MQLTDERTDRQTHLSVGFVTFCLSVGEAWIIVYVERLCAAPAKDSLGQIVQQIERTHRMEESSRCMHLVYIDQGCQVAQFVSFSYVDHPPKKTIPGPFLSFRIKNHLYFSSGHPCLDGWGKGLFPLAIHEWKNRCVLLAALDCKKRRLRRRFIRRSERDSDVSGKGDLG